MDVNRRHLLQAAILTAAAAPAQTVLTEERMRALQPVLDQRQAQLQTLRAFPIDDAVEPSHGCL